MSPIRTQNLVEHTVSEPHVDLLFELQAEFDCNFTAASSAFLTVTVTGPWDQTPLPPSPGNFDPSIAEHLAQVELEAWSEAAPGSPLRQDLAIRRQFFTRQSMHMRTGGSSITWWGANRRIAISET